jgi:hypothetical protein
MTSITGKSLAQTLASMTTEVVLVGDELYNLLSLDDLDAWYLYGLTSKDKCASDASGYCGSPGNVLPVVGS